MRVFLVAISFLFFVASAPAGPATENLPLGPATRPDGVMGAADPAGLVDHADAGPAAGRRASPIFDAGSVTRTVLSLVFVVGLAVLTGWAMKRLARGRGGLLGAIGPGGPSPSGVLEIVGRYPVGRGQTLILLRLDRRLLLLHQATGRRGSQMRTLCEITDADEVASVLLKTRREEDKAVQSGFSEAMHRLEKDFSSLGDEPAGESSPGVGGGGFRVAQVNDEGDRAELLGRAPIEAVPLGPTRADRDGQAGADEAPDIVTLRTRLRGYIEGARG